MRFLVIGAGGHAQEVAWSLRERERLARRPCRLSFLDDRVPPGTLPSGLGAVEGTLDDVAKVAGGEAVELVLGLGLPRSKAAMVARLPTDVRWATVVHPAAVIGPNVSIGEGSYVAAGAILTVNVSVGRFATINLHAVVAHGGVLGDFVSLHPDAHVSGDVRLGDGVELGAGAVVIPGTTLGPWTVLGAGAVAVRSLAGERTYVGVPALEQRRARGLNHAMPLAAEHAEGGGSR